MRRVEYRAINGSRDFMHRERAMALLVVGHPRRSRLADAVVLFPEEVSGVQGTHCQLVGP